MADPLIEPGASPYLRRPRLTDRLATATLGVIEAGGGYGKTSLALEFADAQDATALHVRLTPEDRTLAARIAEAALQLNMPRLAAALQTGTDSVESILEAFTAFDEPVVLILDDVHTLTTTDELHHLAREMPSPHRMVLVVGRHVPTAAALADARDAVRLNLNDLALTADEVAALAERMIGRSLDSRQLATIIASTGGWVTAVLAALRTADPEDLDQALHRGAEQLVDDLLAGIDDDDQRQIAVLAHLPLINLRLAKELGIGGPFERALAAGLPLRPLHSGWSEIPNPVRERLARRSSPESDSIQKAADAYAEAGEVSTAVRLLKLHGAHEPIARLVADTPDHHLLRWHTPELLDIIDELPDEVLARHPRALLSASFLCEMLGDMERRQDVVDRLDRLVPSGHAERPTVDAELASDLAWRLDDESRVRSLIERTLADEEAGDAALARSYEIRGRQHWLFERHTDALTEHLSFAVHFTRSADLWRSLGEPTRAAWPLTWRAVMSEWNTGAYAKALRSLDEARALAVGRPIVEVFVVPFRAMVLTEVGRYDEAQRTIAEARALAAAVGSRSRAAYAAWTAARIASQQGDADATLICVREAEALGIRDSGGGAFFAADAAQLLDRVDLHEEAQEQLDFAVSHDDGRRRFVPVAQIVIDSRAGRFDEAWRRYEQDFLQTDGGYDGEDREWVDPRDHPRVLLMLAYGAHLAGRSDEASRLAIEAFEAASRFDVSGVLLVREPVAARTMLPIAAEGGSSAGRSLLEDGVAFVRVLGAFSVERLGRPLAVPTGVVAQALKMLAVNGGRLTTDALIEGLWPDVDAKLGRQRLRTVLRRLREEVGDDIVHREDENIVFGPGVSIDAVEFDQKAELALRTGDVGAAETAFARYGGELLPDDPYEPWAASERTRLEWRWLAVLDLLTDTAEDADDLARAHRLLQLGIDAQPDVEDRYLRAARLFVKQQRPTRARAMLERAVEALRARELEPSGRLLTILDNLRN